MYTRIVVPLDGSEIAELALLEAEPLAAALGVPLHLVRIIDVAARDLGAAYGVHHPAAVAVYLQDELEATKQYVDAVARSLITRGRRVTTEVRRGPVAEELIAAAEAGDLYVMASHGRSGIARWFMGSIAEDVVRRASVPVLLVKVSSYTGHQTPVGRTAEAGVPAAAVVPT